MNEDKYYSIITKQERSMPFYISTIGCSVPQNQIYRPSGIEDYQLLYTKSGIGEAVFNNKTYELNPGMLFFLPPFTQHNYKPTSDDWSTEWITFSGFAMSEFCTFSAGIWQLDESNVFSDCYNKIIKFTETAQWSSMSSLYLYELLLKLRDAPMQLGEQFYGYKNQINNAILFINKNYDKEITLELLSEAAGMSTGYFCRVFKEYTGLRPIEYLTNLKIQISKALLLRIKSASISETAKKLGYNSPSYFIKQFKKIEGCTPSEFVKANSPS